MSFYLTKAEVESALSIDKAAFSEIDTEAKINEERERLKQLLIVAKANQTKILKLLGVSSMDELRSRISIYNSMTLDFSGENLYSKVIYPAMLQLDTNLKYQHDTILKVLNYLANAEHWFDSGALSGAVQYGLNGSQIPQTLANQVAAAISSMNTVSGRKYSLTSNAALHGLDVGSLSEAVGINAANGFYDLVITRLKPAVRNRLLKYAKDNPEIINGLSFSSSSSGAYISWYDFNNSFGTNDFMTEK